MKSFVNYIRKIYSEVKYPYTESNMSYQLIKNTPYTIGVAIFLSLFKNFFSPGPNFWSGAPIVVDFDILIIFAVVNISMIIIAVIFRKKL